MNAVKEAPDYLHDEHLSQGTKTYLNVLNGGGPAVESLPVPDARRVLADLQAAVPVDLSGVEESERTIESEGRTLRLNLVRPEGTGRERLPVFVFVHGGGWVLGDYPTHRRLVRDLVAESGCAAVFVNYTPSPEARFPQAVEEIYIAVKWVAENGREIGVDGSRLALAGNSVGGNMSLAAALLAKDHGGPQIRTLVLMWPVTDAGYDWDSYVEYGRQRFLTAPLMKWMFEQYVSDPAQRGSDLMSPVRASAERLRGLPPTLIAVAENDILRDEGEKMGRWLDEAGVEVTTVRFNGVIHAQRSCRTASDADAGAAGRSGAPRLSEGIAVRRERRKDRRKRPERRVGGTGGSAEPAGISWRGWIGGSEIGWIEGSAGSECRRERLYRREGWDGRAGTADGRQRRIPPRDKTSSK